MPKSAEPEGLLLTKQDYFACSREQGLPNRCPILDRCERRARTLEVAQSREALNHHFPKPNEPVVPSVGEDAYLAGGRNNFLVGGMCPEVALFDPSSFFGGLSGHPTINGRYDKYMSPQYEILDTGHFSECAEYSLEAHSRASHVHAAQHFRSYPMTSVTNNSTFNVDGGVHGGAVSLGGEAHNSGETTVQVYNGSALQKIDYELTELAKVVHNVQLDEVARNRSLEEIAIAKAYPSPGKIKTVIDTIGNIGTLAEASTALAALAKASGLL